MVHWTLSELLELDHEERRRWVDELMRAGDEA